MMCKIPFYKFPKARGIFSGLLILMFLVLSAQPPAQAQSTRELNGRINRLENEVQTLSRAYFRGEEPPAGALSGSGVSARANADTVVRLQQMEKELSALRGKIEEQGYEVRQMREEMRRVNGDMTLRIEDLEKRRGGAVNNTPNDSGNDSGRLPIATPPQPQPEQSGQSSAQGVSGSGGSNYQWQSGSVQSGNLGSYTQSPSTGEISAKADLAAATYENAFSLLKGNQYEAAEKDFEIFLQQYPNHVLAGNAQYWLGETHYVRGDFDNSARIFAEGYQKYPKGAKAADNLLKLGMSLSALGKKNDACVALAQVAKEGFKGAGPVLRRAEQESSRLNCG